MVGLGHINNFTTIRLRAYITYVCRATVSGFAPLNATPYQYLSISLAYDKAMKLAWLDLVLLTLVFAVLIYVLSKLSCFSKLTLAYQC